MNPTHPHHRSQKIRELSSYHRGNLFILLATAVVMLLGAKSLRAATYYWDTNQGTAGLGGSGFWGTGVNGTNWNTNSTGGAGVYTAAPATGDTLNFGGTAGTVTLSNSSSSTNRYAALNFNTSGYVLTTVGSTVVISNATTTLGNNVNLILSNAGTTLGFRGGVMTGGTGSTLTLAQSYSGTSTNTFYRISLENFDISNNLAINMTGTNSGAGILYTGFIEGGGSSSIKANVTNNTSVIFTIGANSGNTLNMDGVISGTGKLAIAAPSTGQNGTVKLNNVNTYTGDTLVNLGSGTLRLGTNNGISSSSFVQHGNLGAVGGIIDLYGYNQTIAGITSGSTAVGSLTNSQVGLSTLTINQASNTTYGLAIGGNLALVKTNSGNLTLSGASSYSGGTTVSGGTLTASNAAALGSGSVTVGSGGTLSILASITNAVANSGAVSIGGGGSLSSSAALGSGSLSLTGTATNSKAAFTSTQSGSTISIGALTLGGYSTFSMDSGKNVSSSAAITLAGTNNTINLTGSALGVGTYNLLSGTSISKGSLASGGLVLGGAGVSNLNLVLDGSQTLVGRTTYDFTSTTTALQLVVGGGGAFNVVWNGGTGTWDTTTANWQKDGAGSNITFVANDNVTLSTGGDTITVEAGGVTAGTLTANNSSGTQTLTGGNVVANSFSKSGAGSLVVSNALTAVSGVSQSAGTLTTAGNLTISNTGVNISGGTANLNGNNTIVAGGLTVAGGTAVLNGSNTISAGGLNVSSGSLTVNSTNNITGGLNITGGTATINSSSNSISGGVNANGGVLVVNANGALGNNAIAMNGGSLGVGTLGTVTNAVTLGGSGGTVTNDSALTLSGAVTGANNTLTKKGSANLNLSGAMGASGSSVALNLQEGTVSLSGGSFKYLTNSTLNGNLVLSNGSLNTRAATFTGTGKVQVAGTSTWQANSSQSYINNEVNLQAGSVLNISNSVNLNLLGGVTGTGDVAITAGSGGIVAITGNTFTGTITNNTANELRFYNSDVSGISSFGGSGSGTLTFSNSTADRTVGGKITGAQVLAVRGSSVTTFTNTQNDFTNTINVNGSVSGTTAKFVGNSMGAASATAEISLGNNNTLSLDGVTSQRSLGLKSGGGTVYVAGNSSLGTWTNNTSGSSTNGMTLTKSGNGNLTFTGLIRDAASADAPILNIAAGTVTLGASSSTSQYIGINTNSSSYYVGDLAFLAGNQVGMHGSGTMGGGGKILFQGNDAALQTSSSSSNDGANLTIANDIVMNGGAGTKASLAATTSNSLTLNRVLGSGDLYFGTQSGGGGGLTALNGPLSFTGNIYMNLSTNGVLRMNAADVVANNQGIIMTRTNSTAAVTASGTVDLNGKSQTVGFLQSLSNNAAFTGVITSANAATLTLNQSSDTTYGGTLEGALSLVKNGSGIITLANTNTMNGGVTINGGGIYLTNGSKGLGTGTLTMNGGRLAALASGYVVTNAVVISGDSSFGKSDGNGNSFTLSGGVNLNGGTRVLNLDNSLTVSGGISNGGLIVDSSLNRNLTISGATTYADGTTVRGGNLRLTGTGALNSNGALNLAATTAAAGFDISGLSGSGTTIGSLAGASNSSVALGSKNLNLGGNNASTTFAGAISGVGGGLTKSGTGKFTLTGNNTYSGATTVNAGILEVASGASIGSSATTVNNATLTVNGTAGNVTVNSGGTLKGSGTVGALEIASGGTLAVGNSPGTMSASSAIWNGGGRYQVEIKNMPISLQEGATSSSFLGSAGTGWDYLNVATTLTINASSGNKFIIDVESLLANNTSGNASGFLPQFDYTMAIATAAGGILNFSNDYFGFDLSGFTNSRDYAPWMNQGSYAPGSFFMSLSQDSKTLYLNYARAIPEPATGSLLVIGLVGALVARRRYRVRS